jgi:hypothetical protein
VAAAAATTGAKSLQTSVDKTIFPRSGAPQGRPFYFPVHGLQPIYGVGGSRHIFWGFIKQFAANQVRSIEITDTISKRSEYTDARMRFTEL